MTTKDLPFGGSIARYPLDRQCSICHARISSQDIKTYGFHGAIAIHNELNHSTKKPTVMDYNEWLW